MRKIIAALSALLCFWLAGCAEDERAASPNILLQSEAETSPQSEAATDIKNIIEIKEKFFVQQCSDIYYNPDDYDGKTIRIEGLFDVWQDDDGKSHYAVYRKTPGCCGADGGAVGFEVEYGGEKPELDDWVAAEGVLKVTQDENGWYNFVIILSKLAVKTERGVDVVIN